MILLLCINSVPRTWPVLLFSFLLARVLKCGHGKYRSVARHHFAGAWCTSVAAATSDACDRVLWYFGVGVRS